MSKLKQSVGIDLSKDKLDVGPADKRAFGSSFSVIDTQQKVIVKATRKFANHTKGFQELNEWVVKHGDPSLPIVYVMEATGVYYEQLAWFLYEQEQKISVILPNKARQYAGPADQIVHLRSQLRT